MSFLSGLGKLGRVVVGTVLLPVDAVKDIATLGGVLIDDESAVAKRAKKITRNLGDALEELDEP